MKYARTLTVTNRLGTKVSVSLIERGGTLQVRVSDKENDGDHAVGPDERLMVAAREIQQRCMKGDRLQFAVDNRTAGTPISFVPDVDDGPIWNSYDQDDMHYALVDERTLGERS